MFDRVARQFGAAPPLPSPCKGEGGAHSASKTRVNALMRRRVRVPPHHKHSIRGEAGPPPGSLRDPTSPLQGEVKAESAAA